ncbi:hypothetical protein KUH03_25530 [Sphingobacterium sp. E70]|uniref:hypothetical protein n=1 Tax=Sphingobacterium sp. E70 TaxID=2853439 RepID=UPI00211C688E|nr:hypothetical protein [Sphingobacterium sp. E70]ULT22683.1 hypothetical protein KUH03_25530 [Sphingobacterium sp. E70]
MIWKNQVGVGIRIGSSLETSSVEQLTFKDIDIAKMTWEVILWRYHIRIGPM